MLTLPVRTTAVIIAFRVLSFAHLSLSLLLFYLFSQISIEGANYGKKSLFDQCNLTENLCNV